MRTICILLLALTLTGCNEDEKDTDAYRNGYNDGLEDQREHICEQMQSEDAAIDALRDKRICR